MKIMNKEFCGMEKLSVVDFDNKVSCTLFTNGCNFKCPFCHNSSLVLSKVPPLDFNVILDYLKTRKNIIDAAVITGGEPTLLDGLKEKIIEIKKLGFLIKLDTNGTNPACLQELINEKLIDYVAMDIKNGPTNYAKTIGLTSYDLTNIKKSIDILKKGTIDYEFRTTLVKEFHSQSDMKEIRNLILGSKKYYLQQFINRDECICHTLHEVDKKTAEEYLKIIGDAVSYVALRGYK